MSSTDSSKPCAGSSGCGIQCYLPVEPDLDGRCPESPPRTVRPDRRAASGHRVPEHPVLHHPLIVLVLPQRFHSRRGLLDRLHVRAPYGEPQSDQAEQGASGSRPTSQTQLRRASTVPIPKKSPILEVELERTTGHLPRDCRPVLQYFTHHRQGVLSFREGQPSRPALFYRRVPLPGVHVRPVDHRHLHGHQRLLFDRLQQEAPSGTVGLATDRHRVRNPDRERDRRSQTWPAWTVRGMVSFCFQ